MAQFKWEKANKDSRTFQKCLSNVQPVHSQQNSKRCSLIKSAVSREKSAHDLMKHNVLN
jgi:hypothetical protein